MGILDGVVDAVTGGLGGKIVDTLSKYFPPDMTPEQKANVELAAKNVELQQTIVANNAMQEAKKNLNERIAMYEGTASDLKSVPYLGALMLFLRGAQRPVWGFAALFIDWQVFAGAWTLTNPIVQNAFYIVNVLVLGFLFSERAVTNIMPFITSIIKAKSGDK